MCFTQFAQAEAASHLHSVQLQEQSSASESQEFSFLKCPQAVTAKSLTRMPSQKAEEISDPADLVLLV